MNYLAVVIRVRLSWFNVQLTCEKSPVTVDFSSFAAFKSSVQLVNFTLYGHNGPLYNNTVIGTLAFDEWAATFGTVRRCMGRLGPCPVPSSLYQM